MLTLVRPDSQTNEARELLRLVSSWESLVWAVGLVLAPLMGLALLAAGYPWGGVLIGATVSLALSRYGPSWWPGRR